MRNLTLAGLFVLLVISAPAASGAGADRAETIRKAQASTQELAEEFADLVRTLVREGRTEEARETLATLDSILQLKRGLDRLAERLEGPDVIEPQLPGGRVVVKDARIQPDANRRPPPPARPEPKPDDPGANPFEGPRPGPGVKVGIGGGGGPGAWPVGPDMERLRANGGSEATQRAVDLGLEWIARHQDPDGFWDCDGFSKQCELNVCEGAGHALYDPGVTGLALLAFVGAGQTHKAGKHKQTVKDAERYLKQIQDAEGCFGPRTTNHFTYNHAICALAMAELFGRTNSPLFKQSAQMGLDFIAKCQNPYLAWRYGVRPGDNDTSVSGWMISALESGKRAGLRVGEEGFAGMKAWLDKVTEPEYGRVGYTARGTGPARPQDVFDRFPPDRSESLTAVGILSRIIVGEQPRKSETIGKGVELCLMALPRWDETSGAIDMYYWYYGSLAMFRVGGDPWKRWNGALKPALVDHQRQDGDEKGSWDPVGPWGREGGRVYSTALSTLTLETYYRSPR